LLSVSGAGRRLRRGLAPQPWRRLRMGVLLPRARHGRDGAGRAVDPAVRPQIGPMDRAEEARLIGLARGGDLRAFGRLVDAHQAPVRAFLRRLSGNIADADDLAQEAFARTWQVLDR